MKALRLKRAGIIMALTMTVMAFVGCNRKLKVTFEYNADDYITKLGDYKNTVYTPDEKKVSDEEVEQYIENVRHKVATWTEFTDRKVELGDKVSIEVRVVDEDNNYISELSTNDEFELELGSKKMSSDFEGFEEAIVGLMPGRTTQFNAKVISEEDYLEEYKGRTLGFTVAVVSAYKGDLPELNDEFVSAVSYGKYKTVEAYRTGIKKSLQYSLDSEIRANRWAEIIDQIIAGTEVSSYPEDAYNELYEKNNKTISYYAAGKNMENDEYCKAYLECDSVEAYTKKYLLEDMILQKVAKDEHINLTTKEYKNDLDKFAKNNGFSDGESLIEKFGVEYVQRIMLMQKTIDFIYDKSKPKEN